MSYKIKTSFANFITFQRCKRRTRGPFSIYTVISGNRREKITFKNNFEAKGRLCFDFEKMYSSVKGSQLFINHLKWYSRLLMFMEI